MDSQSLRSTIKSARDIMRKDVGCNSDVDRIPQLSWMLFLKCFDDLELDRLALNPKYQLTIPNEYRWQTWAGNKKLTGDDLIKFVNDELFPKLSNLRGKLEYEQRDVIASIFQELSNRIKSGYILRQIIDDVNKIDFKNTDDIQTMGLVYEDMLLQMRNAAGNHGEFYTPRPVIRFIVKQINPNLQNSERVLDPACGTGGFLSESLEHMKKDAKAKSTLDKLKNQTLFGTDKKPIPYILCMMNMLLHNIDKPSIIRTNPLSIPLREITEKDQFEVIMTNPPFGGEEEKGISSNLPRDIQTSDTALSFLIYLMMKLKLGGRCAVILPDGPLFARGVAIKIKKKLLTEFNLHTIIRLPKSVFEPYTSIATNILFFDKNGSTKHIWFYAMKVAERVKSRASEPKYSKTKPIEYEDFSSVEKWFKRKITNDNAWKINIEDIKDFNLDQSNPNDIKETYNLSAYESIDLFIKLRKDLLDNFEDVKKIIIEEVPK